MTSANGRFVIAFNGEIYNHLDLRDDLRISRSGPDWRGHSDTESLLAAFEEWGVDATLNRLVGMFAIALWDRAEHTLYLARDRFGEKPLYYGWVRGAFAFASELKALKAYPGFDNPVCRKALTQYLRHVYVPAPWSIYAGIFKLEPGCLLEIKGGEKVPAPSEPLRPPARLGNISLRRWWALSDVVEAGARSRFSDEGEALGELEARLRDAVKDQSLADVPIGAFLSGGVDSSAIVAMLQQQVSRPVKTFTVGFEEAGFDESGHARAVARHLGTDHTELFVTSEEAQAVIPQLPSMYDEPFGDSSQIPTHLVCKAARQHVTVALSGDGGDEMFGGYNRYLWAPRIWRRLGWAPAVFRDMLGAAVTAIPEDTLDGLARIAGRFRAGSGRINRPGANVHKLGERITQTRSIDDLYRNLISEWHQPAELLSTSDGPVSEPDSILVDPLPRSGVDDAALRMMYWDSISYLPNDILCKVDRAAMAVSLETRVPFLDHRVVEAAWRLPLAMRVRDGQGKWALRQLLYKHVPRELIERPKAGFAIPVGEWIRGPLNEWAEDLLDERALEAAGFLDPVPVRRVWKEHKSGRRDWTPRIWSMLMFQSWLAENS
jgi:asparagine synthase (glutamine-hydrolysing)